MSTFNLTSNLTSDRGLDLTSAQLSAFFNQGAFLQTSGDQFKLFIGPCSPSKQPTEEQPLAFDSMSKSGTELLLYTPEFWDFLEYEKNSASFLKPSAIIDMNKEQFIHFLSEHRLQNGGEDLAAESIQWQKPDRESFTAQFDWIQKKIHEKKLTKGLPLTVQKGFLPSKPTAKTILPCILGALSRSTNDEFLYGFWSPQKIILGKTPEVLIRRQNHTLKTMALAGTWKKNSCTKIDFEDAKIRNEHQLVIDDIRNQMKSFKLIRQSSTTVQELEHLYHLKTEFTYESPQASDVFTALRQLHPTAALGLYPRKPSLYEEFSRQPLQKQRLGFGAPLGYHTPQESFFIVAIRNLIIAENEIFLFSGCGVTEQSHIQAEWDELSYKRASVQKMFGLRSMELS